MSLDGAMARHGAGLVRWGGKSAHLASMDAKNGASSR